MLIRHRNVIFETIEHKEFVMKREKILYFGLLALILAIKKIIFTESHDSLTEQMICCVPFFFCHTLWIQSSIGYNIMPGRKTNFFFGWGHHLPVHDPVFSLGKQWVKEYTIYEPDGNIINANIDASQGGYVCIPYECEKEGTYRLASHIPTGYYSIYKSKKDGKWHHLTDPLDTLENPDETVDKMLISLRYWEWTKAIMTVGKPDGKALEPVGQEMEIMLDKDPIEYKAGDTVNFTLLKNGKPLTEPGGTFYAQDQGRSSGFDDFLYDKVPLNEDGTGSFEITRPAIWHLKVQWGYPAPKEYEDKCWIFAYIASITFQVDPEWGIRNPSYNL
jgi:hypothetical protein